MVDRQLRRKYEVLLRPYGLDSKSINGSTETQHLIVPSHTDPWRLPPLRVPDHDAQVSRRFGLGWRSTRQVPVELHRRDVPLWLNSDMKVREFLAHRHPLAFGLQRSARRHSRREVARSRRCAAELWAALYLIYRALLTYEEAADLLGTDPGRIENVATYGRTHGDLYFAGEPCCQVRRFVDATSGGVDARHGTLVGAR